MKPRTRKTIEYTNDDIIRWVDCMDRLVADNGWDLTCGYDRSLLRSTVVQLVEFTDAPVELIRGAAYHLKTPAFEHCSRADAARKMVIGYVKLRVNIVMVF